MQRFFTDDERAYLATRPDPTGHAAARIAAKEAVYKALQSLPGARGVGWREIEVTRDGDGRPAIRLHGLAARLAAEQRRAGDPGLTHPLGDVGGGGGGAGRWCRRSRPRSSNSDQRTLFIGRPNSNRLKMILIGGILPILLADRVIRSRPPSSRPFGAGSGAGRRPAHRGHRPAGGPGVPGRRRRWSGRRPGRGGGGDALPAGGPSLRRAASARGAATPPPPRSRRCSRW